MIELKESFIEDIAREIFASDNKAIQINGWQIALSHDESEIFILIQTVPEMDIMKWELRERYSLHDPSSITKAVLRFYNLVISKSNAYCITSDDGKNCYAGGGRGSDLDEALLFDSPGAAVNKLVNDHNGTINCSGGVAEVYVRILKDWREKRRFLSRFVKSNRYPHGRRVGCP